MLTLKIDPLAPLGPLSGSPWLVATQIKDRLTFTNRAHQGAVKRDSGGQW